MRAIDADALKADLKQYFTDGVLDGISARLAFNQILHDIDNAPTVERPQGKWEFFSVGNTQYSRCSICKDEHISEYTDLDWWYDNFKYCPNCGAKMTKEAENETD